jgi:hypothetical protein
MRLLVPFSRPPRHPKGHPVLARLDAYYVLLRSPWLQYLRQR